MPATQKRIFYLFITLLLSLLLAPLTPTNAQNESTLPALDTYLRAQVRANYLPGLVAAVVQDGQVIFLQGYGIDPDAQFLLGSTTKSFTALAVMQLVESGKLELDTPVQEVLPWFQVADPQAAGKITIRHLLNQTSGLSAVLDPACWPSQASSTNTSIKTTACSDC